MKQILKMNLSELPEWLRSINKSEPLTDGDTVLLWKGLFLCMRRADIPSIQEERAEQLASLLHTFDTNEGSFRFYGIFLKSISEEWAAIDEWEAHKFVMLLRRVTRQCFVIWHRSSWDQKLIGQLHDQVKDVIPDRAMWSKSIRFLEHFNEIYQNEFAKVTCKKDIYQLAANKRKKTINVGGQPKKMKYPEAETNLRIDEIRINVNSSCADSDKENMVTVPDSQYRALQESGTEYFTSKEKQSNNGANTKCLSSYVKQPSSVNAPFSASILANAVKKLEIMLERQQINEASFKRYESAYKQPTLSTHASLSKSDDKRATLSLSAPLSAATLANYIKKVKIMLKRQRIYEANVEWFDKNQPSSLTSMPLSASTPANGRKKVQIMLTNNRSQEFHEYFQQLERSPKIQYDSSRKPVKGLLKPSIRV